MTTDETASPSRQTDAAPTPLATAHLAGRKLSEVLAGLAAAHPGPRVSVGDLLMALRGRAYGALVTFFGAPLVIPHVPGLSTILGAPLIYLGLWLMLGKRTPWLPRFIADRSITLEAFRATIHAIVPWLERAERIMGPRAKALTGVLGRRVIGAAVLFLALILILPIPFGNMLPGLAVTLFGLALLQRDGLMCLAAWATSVISVVVVAGVVWAMVIATVFLLRQVLGLV